MSTNFHGGYGAGSTPQTLTPEALGRQMPRNVREQAGRTRTKTMSRIGQIQ